MNKRRRWGWWGWAGFVALCGLAVPATAQESRGRWLGGVQNAGINGEAHAALADHPAPGAPRNLIIAGQFASAGGAAARNVARWDGSRWSPLGDGLGVTGQRVTALIRQSDGAILAGGTFRASGARTTNYLARWDGAMWSPLPVELNGGVASLTTLASGEIVATGAFTHAGPLALNRIGIWNGAAWRALGVGVENAAWTVDSIVERPGGRIVALGRFDRIGGVDARNIAEWDGTRWRPLGAGVPTAARKAINLPDGRLMVLGDFTTINSLAAPGVAIWNGAAWAPLTGVFSGAVQDLKLRPDGQVLLLGPIRLANAFEPLQWLYRWDGQTIRPMDPLAYEGSTPTLPRILDVEPTGAMTLGGFETFARCHSPGICRWDGAAWRSYGLGFDEILLPTVAMNDRGEIAISGDFTGVDGAPADRIARWTGDPQSPWRPMDAGLVWGGAAVFPMTNGRFVMTGGRFSSPNGSPSNVEIGLWENARWRAITPLHTGEATTLLPTATGGFIAFGDFSNAVTGQATAMMSWDGAAWTSLDTPTLRREMRSVVRGPAGDFYGIELNQVHRWDGAAWVRLDHQIYQAKSLTVLDDALIVGGTSAPSTGAVARLTPSGWTAMGGNFNASVEIVSIDGEGLLVAGGGFRTHNGQQLRALGRWDGTTWQELGGGLRRDLLTTGLVTSISSTPGGDLIVGGNFALAGDIQSNGVARWAPDARPRFFAQPAGVAAASGSRVILTAWPEHGFAELPEGIRYQWLRDDEALTDGTPASGGATVFGASGVIFASARIDLTLDGVAPRDVARYRVRLTNNEGARESSDAILHVTASCPADFDGSGFVDFFDYGAFVETFELGSLAADINADDFVDFFDYSDFVAAFELGC